MTLNRAGCISILVLSFALIGCASGRGSQSQKAQSGPRPTFKIVGSEGVVKQAGADMLRVPMEPPKSLGNGESIEDAAVLVGGSLVVLRGLRKPVWAASPVEKVDVYRLDGMRRTYEGGTMGPYARGRAYTSPDRTWGIILPTSDGVLYGYSVVTDDAWMSKREITDVLSLEPGRKKPRATFNHEGALVLAGWKDATGRDAVLIIDRQGHEIERVEANFAELID